MSTSSMIYVRLVSTIPYLFACSHCAFLLSISVCVRACVYVLGSPCPASAAEHRAPACQVPRPLLNCFFCKLSMLPQTSACTATLALSAFQRRHSKTRRAGLSREKCACAHRTAPHPTASCKPLMGSMFRGLLQIHAASLVCPSFRRLSRPCNSPIHLSEIFTSRLQSQCDPDSGE